MEPDVNNQPTNPMQPITPVDMQPQAPIGERPKSRKGLIIFVVGVSLALVIALATAGMWLWSSNARDNYVKAVPDYEARAIAANDYFVALKDRLSHGADIKQKFDATIATAPKEPKLLWLKPAPADKVKHVSQITNALKQFETAYITAADVSDYAAKVLPIMDKAGMLINSPTAMEQAKAKFEEAKADTAKLQPPEPVKDFHEKILKAYDDSIGDITRGLAAYNAGKVNDYSDEVTKLSADIMPIRANAAAAELETIFNDSYAKADTAYGELEDVLGIKK